MSQDFIGKTTDADAPFLGASFWEDGKSIIGSVSKIFMTQPSASKGPARAYTLDLLEPVEVDGEEWERVSIGSMAGILMAFQAAKPKLAQLQLKDVVTLTCVGIKPAKREGYSPRVNFELKVHRP